MSNKKWQLLNANSTKWIVGAGFAIGLGAWFIIENPYLPPAIWVTELQAELGDIDAQNDLAQHYYYGGSGDGGISEGLRRYMEAAEAGSTEAMMSLARHYSNGINAPQNEAEEYKWHLKAAELGDTNAMFHVGLHLSETDLEEATEWFYRAAMQGEPVSAAQLARLYQRARNYAEAYVWFSIAVANSNNSILNNSSGYDEELWEVKEKLTPEVLAAAQQRASELHDQILSR